MNLGPVWVMSEVSVSFCDIVGHIPVEFITLYLLVGIQWQSESFGFQIPVIIHISTVNAPLYLSSGSPGSAAVSPSCHWLKTG